MGIDSQRDNADASNLPFEGEPFEQYQLVVEETSRISERRHNTNNFFLSVNSILLGATALLIQQSAGKGGALLLFLALLLITAGFVLCIFWLQLIRGYEKVLEFRFGYLRRLEVTYKERLLQTITTQQKWREDHHVPSFSGIEARIPVVFLVTYPIAAVGAVTLKYDLLALLQASPPH